MYRDSKKRRKKKTDYTMINNVLKLKGWINRFSSVHIQYCQTRLTIYTPSNNILNSHLLFNKLE